MQRAVLLFALAITAALSILSGAAEPLGPMVYVALFAVLVATIVEIIRDMTFEPRRRPSRAKRRRK